MDDYHLSPTKGETVIRKEIEQLSIDIATVKPHPKNVRQGDIGAIVTSLQAHGQYRPIVVQKKTNYILAGNHTFHAAKQLGWKEIAATFVDCNADEALRILLADNKANDLASYDDVALLDLLRELTSSDDGLNGTLFTGDDIDDLAKMLNMEDDLADGAPVDLDAKYEVVIECNGELEQTELLQRFTDEGLRCRAVVL
jgi:ParB-like chromosome segregation protein Spo0J